MNKSSNYPIANRLRVYLGLVVVAGAVFPPSLIITAPTLVGWYKGAKHQKQRAWSAAEYMANLNQAGREYDRAVKSFAP